MTYRKYLTLIYVKNRLIRLQKSLTLKLMTTVVIFIYLFIIFKRQFHISFNLKETH